MNEQEILSSKEFKIRSLEERLQNREQEIKELHRIIENMVAAAFMGKEEVNRVAVKAKDIILQASRGEWKKGILRLREGL